MSCIELWASLSTFPKACMMTTGDSHDTTNVKILILGLSLKGRHQGKSFVSFRILPASTNPSPPLLPRFMQLSPLVFYVKIQEMSKHFKIQLTNNN